MTGPLPVVSGRKVIKALQRAGFVIDRIVGSHYVLADPNDPTRTVTVPYRGSKDLNEARDLAIDHSAVGIDRGAAR